jgi:2,3-dihydroxybenzoate decarboxylase
MQGKIGLEEHFAIEETAQESLDFMPQVVWPELRRRLVDIH